MDRIEQLNSLSHRPLEGLAPRDQSRSTRALVDDRSPHRIGEIIRAARSARVDQPRTAAETIEHLVARHVDGMVGAEIGVDAWIELAVARRSHVERLVSTIQFRLLLLDDVGLNRDAQMIRLTGEVRAGVIVLAIFLEGVVAQIAPEHRRHSEFMRVLKGFGDFDNLSIRIFRAEVDRRADRRCAEIPCLFDRSKHNLLGLIWKSQQLVVIDLDEKGNLVRVLSRNRSKDSKRRCHCITSTLNGEFDDVLTIEIDRVLRETCACRVFDALIDWQDAAIAGACEAPMVEHRMQIAQDLRIAVALNPRAVDEVWTGKMQQLFGDLGLVIQQ